jgi:hypothetical protein
MLQITTGVLSVRERNFFNFKFVAGPGGSVLMQGFYWDVPDGGNWWNTVKAKVTDWSNAGIGAMASSGFKSTERSLFYGI